MSSKEIKSPAQVWQSRTDCGLDAVFDVSAADPVVPDGKGGWRWWVEGDAPATMFRIIKPAPEVESQVWINGTAFRAIITCRYYSDNVLGRRAIVDAAALAGVTLTDYLPPSAKIANTIGPQLHAQISCGGNDSCWVATVELTGTIEPVEQRQKAL